MNVIDINNLLINENAYFYKKLRKISKTVLINVFDKVSENKKGNFLLKVVKKSTENLTYSICIFKFCRKPSFFNEYIVGEDEIKYAYLLIVEYDEFIAVAKKNISGLDLESYIQNLDYKTISRLHISDDTNFEKFNLQNMNLSDSVLRNKSIEAINLKDNLSPLGANKYILNSMRIQNSQNKFSLTFNTSRINQFGDKNNITHFFSWIKQQVMQIKHFASTESFLDVFASPISYEDYATQLNPICILFSLNRLLEGWEQGKIDSFQYEYEGRRKDISYSINKYFNSFNRLLNIEISEDGKYIIKNDLVSDLILIKNPKSITINSQRLKKILINRGNAASKRYYFLSQ